MKKNITLRYYAALREWSGVSEETIETEAQTLAALFEERSAYHGFISEPSRLKVAKNHQLCAWQTPLEPGDTVVFIPPVSGG